MDEIETNSLRLLPCLIQPFLAFLQEGHNETYIKIYVFPKTMRLCIEASRNLVWTNDDKL